MDYVDDVDVDDDDDHTIINEHQISLLSIMLLTTDRS